MLDTPAQAALVAQMQRMLLGWKLLPDPGPDWKNWLQTQEPLTVTSTARPDMVYSAYMCARDDSVLELRGTTAAAPLPELPEDSRLWILGRSLQSSFRLISLGTLQRAEPDRWFTAIENTYVSQRRQFSRIRLQSPLALQALTPAFQDTVPLWMLDFNEGGTLLQGQSRGPDLPDTFVLDLPVAEDSLPLQVEVQVRNRRKRITPEGGLPLYGVRWAGEAQERFRLRYWCEQLRLQQPARPT